ncbi:MAG TPA: hypothetical protein VKZ18_26380 [Polyangia bacterium]|nr:hypothetical protein [Polyangia bacterium]
MSVTQSFNYAIKVNNELDLLFVIDDQASTSEVQSKLYAQLPLFMNALETTPTDLHVAVVTTDMGAPGDSTSSVGCTRTGDAGAFKSAPTGTCTASGLEGGATFLAASQGTTNFTGALATTLQCISNVGGKGCGFVQPLAALDRALGADGSPPPAANAGFLRPEAYLGIVIVSDEDDCSAPPDTQLYSLDVGGSNQQNIANALGPISTYRCNQFGHLCKDPSGALIAPPLEPPSNVMGTAAAPTLDLTDCTSNDTNGLLTPVSQFISDIKALKPDPDNQILVAAIVAPAAPYTVAWVPESGGQNTQPGELWPEVMHSCGASGSDDVNPQATMNPTDGTFGDPAVRISQFVTSFPNSVVTSVCDASYAGAAQAFVSQSSVAPLPPCVGGTIQNNAQGLPDCAVTAHMWGANGTYTDVAYQNCALTGSTPPCWSARTDTSCAGTALMFVDATAVTSASYTVTCSICEPGVTGPGC